MCSNAVVCVCLHIYAICSPIAPPPFPQMGLFGAITNLASFPKDRRALFDTALAGACVVDD